jgi:hypothetical protein
MGRFEEARQVYGRRNRTRKWRDRNIRPSSVTGRKSGGVDVVLDYLWGQSAECLLAAASRAGTDAPIRFIQIGTASGANITLPGAVLRSTPIELKGSGLGSVPVNHIVGAIEELLHAAVAGRFEMATKPVPLSQVEQAWSSDAYTPRVVFTIGENPA